MAFQILIVDDSETMREFILRVITLSGFDIGRCHHASNGQEALEVLRSNQVEGAQARPPAETHGQPYPGQGEPSGCAGGQSVVRAGNTSAQAEGSVVRAGKIDLVLTDVNMPVMNGEEFLARMAADELLRSIPVLVVSTDGTRHRVDRMMSLGAKGYLTKPFTPEKLRTTMEQLLGVTHD